MGRIASFGSLLSGIIAALVMLAFAILTCFVTVFIVQVGGGLAGYTPEGEFVVLSAAILATGAIVDGARPISSLGQGSECRRGAAAWRYRGLCCSTGPARSWRC